jgi:hypothetical protein
MEASGHEKEWRERLGDPDIRVAGLQLWVHGRQYPDSHDRDDGNWLRVTIHCGAAGASVWAGGAILMTSDLARWGSECEAMHSDHAQAATLSSHEPNLRVALRAIDPVGHVRMSVEITPEHMSQRHEFQFDIDQSYLVGLARRCRAILAKYPVR